MRSTALALVGTALLAGCSGKVHGGVGGDDTPARATPGALVAVAMSYLDYKEKDLSSIKSDLIKFQGPPRTIGADINFRGPDSIHVAVSPGTPVPKCRFTAGCVQHKDASGTTQILWDLEAPEEDPGFVSVTRFTDDDVRQIVLSGPKITKDPREMDLPRVRSVKVMRAIVEDPAFAVTTTRGALDASKKLTYWAGRDDQVPDPGPEVPWTQRGLAAMAVQRLWYLDRVGDALAPEPAGPEGEAVGIRFNGDRDHGGGAVAIYLVIDPPAGATNCPEGYQCTREGSLTYGWAPGRAAIFRERPGYVLRSYLLDPGLDLTEPADFNASQLAQIARFSADPELGAEMSSDLATAGADLFEYEDATKND